LPGFVDGSRSGADGMEQRVVYEVVADIKVGGERS